MTLTSTAKALIHLSLIALTTYLIFDNSYRINRYSIATMNNLCNAFLPEDCRGDDNGCRDPTTYDDDRYCRLGRKNATLDSVNEVVDSYYVSITQNSLAGYSLLNSRNATNDRTEDTSLPISTSASLDPLPLKMTAESYVSGDPTSITPAVYNITSSDLGPLDPRHNTDLSIKEFYARLSSFRLSFFLADSVPVSSNTDHLPTACYVWSINVNYVDENESHLRVWVSAEVTGRCDDMDNKEEPGSLNFVLHAVLIFLSAILTLILSFELISSLRDIMSCKQLLKNDETVFNRLPFMLQSTLRKNGGDLKNLDWKFYIRFIHLWDAFLIFACGWVMLSCWGHMLGDDLFTSDVDFFFTGFGCACLWFSTAKYFQSSRRLYAIVLLVARAAPEVASILVGASPLFLAYGLLGTTAFGANSTRFSSLLSSLTTLFSLMNGDIILETLDVVRLNSPFFGPIYIISFFFLFTYFFLNVVLTVVEESLWLLNAEVEQQARGGAEDVRRSSSRHFLSRRVSGRISRHSEILRKSRAR
ncbi:hypothetical protein TrLO_g11621 [Triparma laevis f. longispina]|uniref:Polycystin cation channel PKD1/PKD2 domain-containing protein n=1 Tax=Triparma laevis f. longispina TaxID=1714387 RepID=A0A9W7AY99_9STRA|nr:hypothetical protein TrLO_g11621 [Triparma laevis f. longispina]